MAVPAPAAAPAATLVASFLCVSVYFGKARLMRSLKAKLNAWVGKKRMQLGTFPAGRARVSARWRRAAEETYRARASALPARR